MSKSNFHQYENFMDATGEMNKNVVIMTHFEFDRPRYTNYSAQIFYRFPDGTLKPVSEQAYAESETHAILSLFVYHQGFQRTIDEYDYEVFKSGKSIEAEVI